MAKAVNELKKAKTKIEKSLEGRTSGDPAMVGFFRAEVAFAMPRKDALCAVLAPEQAVLTGFLATFEGKHLQPSPRKFGSVDASPAASEKSTNSTCAIISKAPPIKNISLLKSEMLMKNYCSEKAALVADPAAKTVFVTDIKAMILLFYDLVKSANDAVSALDKRPTDYEEVKKAKKGQTSTLSKMEVLKAAQEVGDETNMASVESATLLNWQRPSVITKLSTQFSGPMMSKAFSSWQRDFKRDILDKGLSGRRTFELDQATIDEVNDVVDRHIFQLTDASKLRGITAKQTSDDGMSALKSPIFSRTVAK